MIYINFGDFSVFWSKRSNVPQFGLHLIQKSIQQFPWKRKGNLGLVVANFTLPVSDRKLFYAVKKTSFIQSYLYLKDWLWLNRIYKIFSFEKIKAIKLLKYVGNLVTLLLLKSLATPSRKLKLLAPTSRFGGKFLLRITC